MVTELKSKLLKQGFTETGRVTLDISEAECWVHYFADNCVNSFTEFWRQELDASDITSTNWGSSVPDLGKDHTRKDDDFTVGF